MLDLLDHCVNILRSPRKSYSIPDSFVALAEISCVVGNVVHVTRNLWVVSRLFQCLYMSLTSVRLKAKA